MTFSHSLINRDPIEIHLLRRAEWGMKTGIKPEAGAVGRLKSLCLGSSFMVGWEVENRLVDAFQMRIDLSAVAVQPKTHRPISNWPDLLPVECCA